MGHKRESLSLSWRLQAPYLTFKTNNFVTPKNLLLRCPFDESVIGYGHEDTVWAYTLKSSGIPMMHIDNPIVHQGLETDHVLLRKIENALDNLLSLKMRGIHIPVRVLVTYHRYKHIFKLISKLGISTCLRNRLIDHKASLLTLDLYKLMYLAEKNVS